ncbi:MAG TPA: NlpC/P60 family protein [Promineifilum sp.]|nr:NlpC/P60 family protein [Promineifilum sp.]
MSWVCRYIGLPYRDHGRTRSGVDCWGLVRLIYKNELGIDLPSYAEISAEDLMRAARAIDAGKDGELWRGVPASDIVPFDVAVMRHYGRRTVGHVGIVTPERRILHVEISTDSVVVPMDHYTVRERLACFRRFNHPAG